VNKNWIWAIGLALAGAGGWLGFQYRGGTEGVAAKSQASFPGQISTKEYIAGFDQKAHELAGTDYINERYNPRRLKKPLDQIDIDYDYDFARLKQVSYRLEKVDRRAALKAIFDKVTAWSRTDTERHLAILKFLHKTAFQTWIQPMYEDRSAVYDPIVLLELSEMRCGTVARIGVDMFEAAGYPGRIVQAVSHQSAEIFYDNDWHLFEADLAGGGQSIMIDGRILSIAELSRNPYLIDAVPTHFEILVAPHPYKRSLTYPSYFFFSKEAYRGMEPSVYYKDATPEQMATDRWYGWMLYRTNKDESRKLSVIPRKYEPDPPKLTKVRIIGGRARISWKQALDADGDLLGYRVYISKYSRGWNYQEFSGKEEIRRYWRGGWKPGMYDAMFREPPSDAGLITTSKTSVEFDLPAGETRFITVMPFDKHGESVGRKLYNMSEELTLTNRGRQTRHDLADIVPRGRPETVSRVRAHDRNWEIRKQPAARLSGCSPAFHRDGGDLAFHVEHMNANA